MKNKLTLLFVAALAALLTGCGGGTVGTDGGAPLRVAGTVTDTSGEALADALVILEATGDSARANQRGQFVISTTRVERSRFRVDAVVKGADLSVTSEEVVFDQASEDITFSITVSVEEGAATVEDIEVKTLAPTPTPLARGTAPLPSQTPVSSSSLRGVIRDQSGSLVKGVQVTVDGDRNSAVSNRNGVFELTFTPRDTRIGLLFEYQNQRARISLSGLPATPTRVSLKVQLEVAGGKLGPQAQSTQLVKDFSFRVR